MKLHAHLRTPPFDRGDRHFFRLRLQERVVEQILNGWGRRAKTILQLFEHFLALRLRADLRDALVRSQAQVLAGDVYRWDAQINAKVDRGAQFGGRGLALDLGNRVLEHLRIEVKANRVDVSMLLASQQIARAAQLEIEGGNAEPGARDR